MSERYTGGASESDSRDLNIFCLESFGCDEGIQTDICSTVSNEDDIFIFGSLVKEGRGLYQGITNICSRSFILVLVYGVSRKGFDEIIESRAVCRYRGEDKGFSSKNNKSKWSK